MGYFFGKTGSGGDRLRQLEALMSAGGEAVALLDPSWRVLVAAPALAAALKRPAADLEGKTLGELGCPPQTIARLGRALDRALSDGAAGAVDPHLAPGRDLTLTPSRDTAGRPWAVAVTAAAGLRGEVARFLSAANHDLRQPFQAMHLFHHLLESRLSDPKQLDLADKLGLSIAAADRNLTSLVQAARLDAGILTPDIRAFPLAMLLIPMVEEFRSKARAADLRFKVHFGPAEGDVAVVSDQQLLDLALRCLLDNAVRFTAKGGVLLGVRPRPGRLVVEVWDTGPGIAEADRDAVWQDFRRLDVPPRNGVSGMGLGLGLVRRVARLLDHPATLRSRDGRGSVFAIEVPVAN